MLVSVPFSDAPQDIYTQLMASRRGVPIQETLARILSSWLLGQGALPEHLGLNKEHFEHMMALYFPNFPIQSEQLPNSAIDYQRSAEADELRQLLLQHRTQNSLSEQWMADIVVAGCMGGNHLWQDLGLWNRSELSQLMRDNFSELAKRNDKDMKWKKFLYKQLCEAEGIYVCRAPSCEVCNDYQLCFGPEE